MGKRRKNRSDRQSSPDSISAEEINVAKQYELSPAIIPSARETMRRLTRKVRNEAPFLAVMADELWDSGDAANIRYRMFAAAWLATIYARSWNQKRVPEAFARVKSLQAKIEDLTEQLHLLIHRELPCGSMRNVLALASAAHGEEPLGHFIN